MSRLIRLATRRRFLLQSTRSLLAAGVWSTAGPASARSSLERLRIAAIGVANRGETNVLSVAKENVVALCDVDRRYLDERRERFPDARTYADYRELLDRERDLDAVIISTPDHTHAHAAILALRRRLHVYCEKPLVHRHAELEPLVSAAKRAEVATQTGNQHRASDGYRRAVAWLQTGVLGAIREVHVWTDRPIWRQAGGRPASQPIPPYLDWDLWLGPAPERPYAAGYHPLNWRGFWDFGGGALGDRGPHLLDPLVAAWDLPPPSEITAQSHGATDEMAPEWSIVQFTFPRTPRMNVEAPVWRLTWYDGGKQPSPETTGIARLPNNGCLVMGSEGRMFLPELGGEPRLLGAAGRNAPAVPRVEIAPASSHIDEWLEACRGRGRTSSPFLYGARLTEICLLGNVALRAGRSLKWDAKRSAPADNDERWQSWLAGPAVRGSWQLLDE